MKALPQTQRWTKRPPPDRPTAFRSLAGSSVTQFDELDKPWYGSLFAFHARELGVTLRVLSANSFHSFCVWACSCSNVSCSSLSISDGRVSWPSVSGSLWSRIHFPHLGLDSRTSRGALMPRRFSKLVRKLNSLSVGQVSDLGSKRQLTSCYLILLSMSSTLTRVSSHSCFKWVQAYSMYAALFAEYLFNSS